MARQIRLAVAGEPHLLLLSGLPGRALCEDDDDRRRFLSALRDAATQQRCALHAHALLDDQALWLLTPDADEGPARLVQELGRRYVAVANRRHGRRGPLWNGRFRTAIVQPGERLLQALLFVDLLPVRAGACAVAAEHAWSSARHHVGLVRDPLVIDHAAWWQLGNTPFEREQACRRLLDEGLPPRDAAALDDACRKGWALGDAGYLSALADRAGRPVQPRRRGRPPGSKTGAA